MRFLGELDALLLKIGRDGVDMEDWFSEDLLPQARALAENARKIVAERNSVNINR